MHFACTAHCRVFASKCASAAWRVRYVHMHQPACMHPTLSTRLIVLAGNRPNVMRSETISERYGSGYGVAVRAIALQGGAAGSRSRTGATEELRSRPAPRSSLTPPRSIIVSQIRSLNPAFPCIAFRIKASPFLPMPLFERSHSINAPLAASAGARAAAPAAPRRLLLRLRNSREHATGHQQGKRRLRIKFWTLGELTQFSSARH